MELLKYKGYKGSVSITQDGEYKGVVLGLERNAEYTGKSFEELKQQFKCKVENLLHYCEHEGINPDYFVSTEKNTMQSKKYLVVFGVLGFAWLAWLWFYFDNNIGSTGIAQQTIASVGETSDWWKDAGSFFNNFSTPVLSLLSFIALLWTIYQQIASHKLSLEELRYTREELELTRNELKKSADAQELTAKTAIEQQKLIQLQQFEATFFSLLSNHEVALDKAIGEARKAVRLIESNDLLGEYKQFNFHGYQSLVSYFIVLYQIIKFVDESTLSNVEEKKKYTSLLRAYLPSDILIVLAFNCYVDYKGSSEIYNNYWKYKQLVETYSILEHLTWSSIVAENKDLLPILLNSYEYEPCAFGVNVKYAIGNLEENLSSYILYCFSQIDEIKDIVLNIEKREDEIEKNKENIELIKSRMAESNNLDDIIKLVELKSYDMFKGDGISWSKIRDFEKKLRVIFPQIDVPQLLDYSVYQGVIFLESTNRRLLENVDDLLEGLYSLRENIKKIDFQSEIELSNSKIEYCLKSIEKLEQDRIKASIKNLPDIEYYFFEECRDSSILCYAMKMYLQKQRHENYPEIRSPTVTRMVDIPF